VWRFSDHWSARLPDEFAAALADTLGWRKPQAAAGPLVYAIASTTLGALAAHARARLGIRGGLRMIGKADMRIQRVVLSPGTTSLQATIDNLPQADAILSGEPREWEAVEYVLDTASTDRPKGMIAVGRLVSQEPGMRACAAWLRSILPEVPVDAVAAGDPYWRPTFAKASASAKATADKTVGRPR
jgi:hypothetical protein